MSFQEVIQAVERISRHVHRTPVHTYSTVDRLVGRNVFFKCENLQKTGSFKPRGALNAVSKSKTDHSLSGNGGGISLGGVHCWGLYVSGGVVEMYLLDNPPPDHGAC